MNKALQHLYLFGVLCSCITMLTTCKKTDTEVTTTNQKPKADFTFTFKNPGLLPDTASFTSTSTGATSYRWDLDNGSTSDLANPQAIYTTARTYQVKLVATNQYGSDSVTKPVAIVLSKPVPHFTYIIRNAGSLPDTVDFVSTTTNASTFSWDFGDGQNSTATHPQHIYTTHGTFQVKLVATNAAGSDSITNAVNITLNKPKANFSFTISNLEVLPVVLAATNSSTGSKVSYAWSFGNGATSSQQNPTHQFTAGGIYQVKLVATNAAGSDSLTREIRISPYPQAYKSINGPTLNLYAWEGSKVMILSRASNLNRATMFKWVKAMDTTYNYYKACTGREPAQFAPTYLNNRTTIADVPATCGAGCGYIGFTGFELQNGFFDFTYNAVNNGNWFDHLCFYEFGRNFWFYGSKLDYKEPGSFPIAGGFAVFMGSMEARNAVGVTPEPDFDVAKRRFENLLTLYLASPNLNWANTLAVDKGVPGQSNAADLFVSMCMRLKRDYAAIIFYGTSGRMSPFGLMPRPRRTRLTISFLPPVPRPIKI